VLPIGFSAVWSTFTLFTVQIMKKKNIGSSFDSWLSEEGIREAVTATAIKRVLAREIEAAKKTMSLKPKWQGGCKPAAQPLDRLLDPDYDAVTLSTLRKAATAVGRELRLELR
jgi:antitoxin HicB